MTVGCPNGAFESDHRADKRIRRIEMFGYGIVGTIVIICIIIFIVKRI